MTLASSGSLTLNGGSAPRDVATELGRAGTGITLAGSSTDSDVKTLIGYGGGSVVFPNDFYGKSSIDAVPDPVTWSSIDGSDSGVIFSNEDNYITGINVTITLRLSFSGTHTLGGFIGYDKNDTGSFSGFAGSSTDISIANGDKLQFAGIVNDMGDDINGTVTVSNLSDGGTVIASFGVAVHGYD